MRLSVCMIVRDEAGHIAECLEGLKGLADEVIVVDTGSSDDTPQLARAYGAKVFEFRWTNDFSAARNESLRHATGDYILWIDADDRIPPEERGRFLKWKESLPQGKDKAFWFVIESPEASDDFFSRYALQIRAFPNLRGVRFIRRIHESVLESLLALGVKLEETDLRIRHIGYSDPLSVQRKARRNLKMLLGALAEAPEDFVVYWHLSQTYGVLGEYEQALRYAKEFLEKGNFQGQLKWRTAAILNVGKCYERLGEMDSAAKYYEMAEREDPDDPMVLFTYAHFLLQKGEIEEAKGRLIRLKEIQPNPTPVPFPHKVAQYYCRLWLGGVYAMQGEEDRALEEYAEAFSLNPDYAPREFYCKAGELALRKGKDQLALKFLEKAKDLELSPELLSNLGIARRRTGDLEGAEKALRDALSLNPLHFEALSNLSHLLLFQGRFEEAEAFCRRALEVYPYALDLRLGLCLIHAVKGRIEDLLSDLALVLNGLGLEVEGEIEDLGELALIFSDLAERLSWVKKNYEAFLAKKTAGVLEELNRGLSLRE